MIWISSGMLPTGGYFRVKQGLAHEIGFQQGPLQKQDGKAATAAGQDGVPHR